MSTIRLQALDGTWETLGTGRYRGIAVEQVQASSNLWGPDTLSASLQIVDPQTHRPDLSPFTPVELEESGQLVWAGRIIDTPASDTLSIQAQGWQYHLDDDAYQASYVHTRLSDYTDVRPVIGQTLGSAAGAYAAGTVANDEGGVVLTGPKNAVVANGNLVGAVLDLGPDSTASRVIASFQSSNNSGDDIYLKGAADKFTGGAGETASTLVSSGATGTLTLNVTNRRYIQLFLYHNTAYTLGADVWVRFVSVQVFASTAYESGSASILKAADVVKHARLKAPQLNQANTLLVDGNDFSIPHLAESSYRTPREWMMAANAYEDDVLKIGGNDLRSIVMKDKPTAAIVEVGNWSGSSFQDGGNSGEAIYNRVIVEGTGPDGAALSVIRLSSDAANPLFQVSPNHVASNPSFATNTATWTATTSTITRDTGTFDTTPASGRWDNTGASDYLAASDRLEETLTGTFLAGAVYTVRFRLRPTFAAGVFYGIPYVLLSFGDIAASNYAASSFGYESMTTATWYTFTLAWTPTVTTTTCLLRLTILADSNTYFHIDSVDVLLNKTTVVDRRSFTRTSILPIGAPLTSAVGQRLGDLWLAAHRTPSFRGSVSVAPGGVRQIIGGAERHPSTLLREAGEFMRFAHRTTPEDGSLGRDGRIVSVSYDAQTETASIQIDNSRRDFETLLERFGGVVGNVLQ